MRTSLAAATMAASLTIGGAAGAVLFTPTLSGAQAEDTTQTESIDEARPEPGARLAEILAPLVEDGTLTQAEADAVIAAVQEAAPFRHGDARHGRTRHEGAGTRGVAVEAVSDVLGLSGEEIRTRLADGQSLADVAEAEGVEVQALVDAIVSAGQDRLDQAVANGRLTEDAGAQRAEMLAERAADAVERTFDGDGPRGRAGHRGDAGRGT